MDRLFLMFCLSVTLAHAPMQHDFAQPVFFSMLFPQLMPQTMQEAAADEAVFL